MAYALGFPKNITDMIYELRDWPPRRPRRTSFDRTSFDIQLRDGFLTDFENAVLEDWGRDIPTGPRRFEKAEWALLVQRNVYPNHSDVDWYEYCDWVSSGGGDEWFMEDY